MFTSRASSIDGSLRHEVDVNNRHTIITDEPLRLGGSDQGPAPHELLAAALAACVSTMVVLYGNKREWTMTGTYVDVTYDAEVTPRSFIITVHLPDNLDAQQKKRLEKVAQTCPLRRALEAGSIFDEAFIYDARS